MRQAVAGSSLLGALLLAGCAMSGGASSNVEGPARVTVVRDGSGYALHVDGQPFLIKGAGLDGGDQEALAAHGGNSFRTWRPGTPAEPGGAMLDRAHRNGLRVALGIPMPTERHGFDYRDADAVAAEIARVRAEVERYRRHPALLMWVVGNELNLEGKDPAVWDAIGRIADMIHAVDPHHPVMTTLAGVDPRVITEIKRRAPSLDLIGVQLYGDIEQLHERMRASGWTGPYIVTEWGPTGHWESPATAWGAPLEDDASRKAELLLSRYTTRIAPEFGQALGSYVFLWGQKQERTPTWYGLFMPGGESTPGVDAMQYAWTGTWPDNRAPAVSALRIDGRTGIDSPVFAPGRSVGARIAAHDVDGDRLEYRWMLREESRATSVGGDPEAVPREIDVGFGHAGEGRARFAAPREPGAYRLFVEVHDGRGHAAYANVPFRVAGAADTAD